MTEGSDPNKGAPAAHGVDQSSGSTQDASNTTGVHHATGSLPALIIGSIGVVYGDIGTSPLYALRKSLAHSVKADVLSEEAVVGAISLLIFALLFTVTAKYVLFLMRADNRGEGGILRLWRSRNRHWVSVACLSSCSAQRVQRCSQATPSSRRPFR